MNTRITVIQHTEIARRLVLKNVAADKDFTMEPVFLNQHDFITFTKGIVYLIMAGMLVGLPLFWKFLTGNDEDRPTF